MTDQLQPVEPTVVSRVRRSQETAKLDEALAKASMEFTEIIKEAKNEAFKRGDKVSKYADMTAYVTATRAVLGLHGITLRQWPFNEASRIGVTSRLCCQGQWEEADYSMPLAATTAHGVGAAITYARRYAYAAILNLAADDDDGNAASGVSPKTDAKASSKPPDPILAINRAAREGKKTEEAVMAYMRAAFDIGSLVQLREVQEKEPEIIDQIIRWCLNSEQDLQATLKASVKAVGITPKMLYTAATRRAVPDEDVKIFIKEHFGAESSKTLNQAQLKETLDWIETVGA